MWLAVLNFINTFLLTVANKSWNCFHSFERTKAAAVRMQANPIIWCMVNGMHLLKTDLALNIVYNLCKSSNYLE